MKLMKQSVIVITLTLAMLAGCSRSASNAGQTATVALKDGTTATGTVTKSDNSSITLQTPAGVVSTYPMSQVASVTYVPSADTASNSAPAAAPPDQATSSAPPPPAGGTAPAAAPPPAREYQPADNYLTIPSGTTLAVRTDQTIDSKTAAVGQEFSGSVAREVQDSNGNVAIPRGSRATLVIRGATSQGKVQGQSELAVDVAEVNVNGRTYRLETTDFVERGKQGVGTNRRTAEYTGGGSALGTIIGAIAGGGKGAAIGALSGAAAGAVTQSATRGAGVRIPAETVLNFRLEAPIRIREMR